jgi:hypothetical protein
MQADTTYVRREHNTILRSEFFNRKLAVSFVTLENFFMISCHSRQSN